MLRFFKAYAVLLGKILFTGFQAAPYIETRGRYWWRGMQQAAAHWVGGVKPRLGYWVGCWCDLLFVAALATLTAFAAGTTVAVVVATGAVAITAGTLAALATLGLYVAFGFGLEGAHRQAVLAGLLVDLDEFHLYGVTLFET